MLERSPDRLLARIRRAAHDIRRHTRVMEVCGTHTHAIGRGGLRGLMPANVELLSGPGCPVCVTAQGDIERVLALARMPGIALCTFGDMVRVPGLISSLERERAAGADVRVVYSPVDAMELAVREPATQVVFLAVGFETTSPGTAAVIRQAQERDVTNFSILVSHKLIVPAMEAVVRDGSRLDGFLTPGHVSVVIGAEAYQPLALRYSLPCVATGFEPQDVLEGVAVTLDCIAEQRAGSFVQYARAIKPGGNQRARTLLMSVFDVADVEWRGLGVIPKSGLTLKPAFRRFDAGERFQIPQVNSAPIPGCRCGDVLKGLIHPPECSLFGRQCTPRTPVGPCMVSSEGSCSARHKYG